jgi:hypothetical protein
MDRAGQYRRRNETRNVKRFQMQQGKASQGAECSEVEKGTTTIGHSASRSSRFERLTY